MASYLAEIVRLLENLKPGLIVDWPEEVLYMNSNVQESSKYRFSIARLIVCTTVIACAVAVGKNIYDGLEIHQINTAINLGLGLLFFTLPIVMAYAASSMSRILRLDSTPIRILFCCVLGVLLTFSFAAGFASVRTIIEPSFAIFHW